MTSRRLAGAVAAAVATGLIVPGAAGAHAVLESTQPARGAQLARAPDQVTLRFDEPVEVQLGAVRVFDAGGREVQAGSATHPGGRQDTIAVRLGRALPAGGYTVTYRVISADSHPVSGGLVFQVGRGGRPAESVDTALSGSTSGPVTATAFAAARAVQFAAIALALGAWLFVVLCWLPALRLVAGADGSWTAASRAFAARTRTLTLAACGAGVLSGLAGLALQGATGEGTSLWRALNGAVLSDVLATRFGRVWGLALLAWAALAVLVIARRAVVPVLRPASLGAGGQALPGGTLAALALRAVPLVPLALLPALSGHAGVEPPTWLMLPANVVHVLCAGAWIGGILVMVVALRAATAALELPDRSPLLAAAVGRFSTVAGVAVALILATGVAQSLVALDSLDQVPGTAYGRAVLVKLVLFAALVGFGAVNRRRTLPALRRAARRHAAPAAEGRSLLVLLRTELALGAIVLAVTGALATYPPGDVQASGPYSTSAALGPARAEITVDPARTGPNELHLYLFDRRTGAQYHAVKELTATAALPAKRVPAVPLALRQAGPGHYVSSGAGFPIAGTWTLTITARVSAFDQHTWRVRVPVRGG